MYKITAFILSLILFFALTPISYAHVLKTSGSVGAVVHVSPEDDPIAGEATEFFFEFKDKQNKFKPDNCDCNVIVYQSGKEVYTAPLFQNNTDPSLTNASFSYTFPQRDIYKVKISGKPTTANAFEPFNLEYDIRVERVSETLNNPSSTNTTPTKPTGIMGWVSTHIPHIIGGIIVFIFLIFALLKQRSNKNVK